MQVQAKLKLVGIEAIYLATSGERVTRLDELQDIDELQVVEAKTQAPVIAASTNGHASDGPRSESGNSTSTSGPGTVPQTGSFKQGGVHRIVAADTEIVPNEEDGDKYARKSSKMKRSLQQYFPSLFQPTLPVTRQDINPDGSRRNTHKRRRRGRSLLEPKNLLVGIALISLLATLIFMYSRLQPRPPRY
eukprot:jgi/Botrbrau1/10483/Bobra.0133s0086.2